MIKVPFDLEPSTNTSEWLEYARYMPWLDFLVKHAYNIEVSTCKDERRFLIIATYKFHLKPHHETIYRLKYSNN